MAEGRNHRHPNPTPKSSIKKSFLFGSLVKQKSNAGSSAKVPILVEDSDEENITPNIAKPCQLDSGTDSSINTSTSFLTVNGRNINRQLSFDSSTDKSRTKESSFIDRNSENESCDEEIPQSELSVIFSEINRSKQRLTTKDFDRFNNSDTDEDNGKTKNKTSDVWSARRSRRRSESSSSNGSFDEYLQSLKKPPIHEDDQSSGSNDKSLENFIVDDDDSIEEEEDTSDDETSSPDKKTTGKEVLCVSSDDSDESIIEEVDPESSTFLRKTMAILISSDDEASDEDSDGNEDSDVYTKLKKKEVYDLPDDENSISVFEHVPADIDYEGPAVSKPKPTRKPKRKHERERQIPEDKLEKDGKSAGRDKKVHYLSFLNSLSLQNPEPRCHPEAVKYVKSYNRHKMELARVLFKLYNEEAFGGCLPPDMEIKWSNTLLKTAGTCSCRRTIVEGKGLVRFCIINLATKVLDSADRLRDTLIHEMCHATTWIISGYHNGHGILWKDWAQRAMRRFPELPVIARCHNYQIRKKFIYKCTQCGYQFGRHSKSLDTERKVCGKCRGRFELLVNYKGSNQLVPVKTPAQGEPDPTAPTPRTPNPFAIFVKENYKKHRTPGTKHGDVMKILSTEFAKTKI